jgi:hypothetical protein
MSNTLTGLIPTIYNAMNVVSREMVGILPAVSRDAQAQQAAVGQTVRSPVVPAMAAADIVPGNIAASAPAQTIDYVDIVINKQRKVPFMLTGEEERGLGPNNQPIALQRFAQAFRTLVNEMESDLCSTYVGASRAFGVAGTTPFGTGDDLTDLSEVLRILDDNGAPKTDRHVILGSAAVAKLIGKQPSLFKVNEAGDALTRRFGILQDMFGAELHHSGQIRNHVKGTGVNYVTSGSTAPGVRNIALVTGTGTVLAGDVVTFAADAANKYVVETGVAAPGTITLNRPGARITIPTANAMTVGNNYTANMAFSRDAIQLAARLPAVPSGGDQADDRIAVTDPFSGVSFEVSIYRQYRQVSYEVAACWGWKVIKSEHLALMLG